MGCGAARPLVDRSDIASTIETEHAAVLEAVEACADAVYDTWEGTAVSDPERVGPPLRHCLEVGGTLEALAAVLEGLLDQPPRAPVVPAPPYVVVTSRGPMLRATVPGGRLVVLLQVFAVADGTYHRCPLTVEVDY